MEAKPVVIFFANGSINDKLVIESEPLPSYLAHFLNCDVVTFGSSYIPDTDLRLLGELHQAGLLLCVVVTPSHIYIEEEDYAEIKTVMKNIWPEIPILVSGYFRSEKIVPTTDVAGEIEKLRVSFNGSRMDRLNELLSLKTMERPESVLVCSEHIEYGRLTLDKGYLNQFMVDTERISSFSEAERQKFDDDLLWVMGRVRQGRGSISVADHPGLGPNIASLSMNDLTWDMFLSQRGLNHGLAAIKARFWLEGLFELLKEKDKRVNLTSVNGCLNHEVGDFTTPIVTLNWPFCEKDEESTYHTPVYVVAQRLFDLRVAIPVDKEKKLACKM